PASAFQARGPAVAAWPPTPAAAAGPAAAAPAVSPPPAVAPVPAPAPAVPAAEPADPAPAPVLVPDPLAEPPERPAPPLPESLGPSRTFFGPWPPPLPVGAGTGRLREPLASCSADMAWYMSKPTKDRNLYVMYGAKAAMNSSTIPAMGSAIEARSASMGAEIWVMATRKITTSTSLEKIRATTKVAHLENQPFVASHEAPARAMGAKTTATSSSAERMIRENHTIAAAVIMSPPRKMVRIAPTPGAVMLIASSPAASRAMRSPRDSMVLPLAWTIPMVS